MSRPQCVPTEKPPDPPRVAHAYIKKTICSRSSKPLIKHNHCVSKGRLVMYTDLTLALICISVVNIQTKCSCIQIQFSDLQYKQSLVFSLW